MKMAITIEQIEAFKKSKRRTTPHYNRFYGMEKLFRDLASVPDWMSLNVHLEHGVFIDHSKPDQYLAGTNADHIFVDSARRKAMVPHKKNVFVLGPLFMRFRRKHGFKYDPGAKGTIAFPSHSFQ